MEGKIFLGGLTWQTTEDMLKTHFGKWGSLNDVILMRNKITGEPRGFGFVQFMETACEYRLWHLVFVFFVFFHESIDLNADGLSDVVLCISEVAFQLFILGRIFGGSVRFFVGVFSIQYRCCGSVSLLCRFAREDDFTMFKSHGIYDVIDARSIIFFHSFFPFFFGVLVNSIRWS